MIRFCPECGGDLVRWQSTTHANGFDLTLGWLGCPKVRDEGAGSPPGDDWRRHYSTVLSRSRTSRFDPFTGKEVAR